MNRHRLFLLKNHMLIGNLAANLVGVLLGVVLIRKADVPIPHEITTLTNQIHAVFLPILFLAAVVFILIYERPIRKYIRLQRERSAIPRAVDGQIHRKLLNEPFVLIAMDAVLWVVAAFVYAGGLGLADVPDGFLHLIFLRVLTTGMITIVAAFFTFEFIMERSIAPHFFPQGRLYSVPKTFRINIRTRLIALLFACNLIPLCSITQALRRVVSSDLPAAEALDRLYSALMVQSLVFAAISVALTFLVSSNLVRPLRDITRVLRAVHLGSYDRMARVYSNDEIGYAGDVINEMTAGLRERDEMQHSMDLAMEVQQSLLPRRDPEINGIDIAGRSIYCDETGGDYYDFLDIADGGKPSIAVAVGDVSGHGISSALLMATARGFLRQRSSLGGGIEDIVSDVNRQLTMDVEESSLFMTLFYVTLDVEERRVQWVRAGHEPGILYDPASDTFEELRGPGIALGVNEEYGYQKTERTGLSEGQIILVGTDGLWETTNPNEEMFGKEPIYDMVRRNASAGAEEISDSIFQALSNFKGNSKAQDDVTLVVMKMERLV